MKLNKLLSFAEYKTLGDDAVARGMWRNDRRVFLPGMGWYNDWYLSFGRGFLSPHYQRDWVGKRSPIEVVCPDGNVWCIDRMSSNGNGWTVMGQWPNITCSPSIDCAPMGTTTPGGYYHGYLRDGEFTDDIGKQTWPIPNIGPDYGRKD
jgi:hypothetical protein